MSWGLIKYAWRSSRAAPELAEHQRAVVTLAAGDVLLGHQVHAVAQRRDDHDIGGAVERSHFYARIRHMQIDDGRAADALGVAIDPAHQPIDVVSELPIQLTLSHEGIMAKA